MPLTLQEGHVLASVETKLSPEEDAVLHELEQRLDEKIKLWFPKGCFLVVKVTELQ